MSEFFLQPPKGFEVAVEVATSFIECEGNVLLVQRGSGETAPYQWAIPGGKLEAGETPMVALLRELKEELDVQFSELEVQPAIKLFVRHPIIDYCLHVYTIQLDQRPEISLNPQEHVDYTWQPMSQLHSKDLIEGQLDVFKIVYSEHRPPLATAPLD